MIEQQKRENSTPTVCVAHRDGPGENAPHALSSVTTPLSSPTRSKRFVLVAVGIFLSRMFQKLNIMLNHHPHQFLKGDGRLPFKLLTSFGGISYEQVHFRRAQERRIDFHIGLPLLNTYARKRLLDKVAYTIAFPSGYHIIIRLLLLKH